MIEEAISKLQELVEEGMELHAVTVAAEPADVYYLHDRRSGDYKRTVAEPKPRSYKASRLADVVDLVKEFNKREPEAKIVVFAAGGQVTAVLDEAGSRRERITLSAPKSKQFQFLSGLLGRGLMGHFDFVNMLKVDLHQAVPVEFLGLVKSMKFAASASGVSDVSVGRESMGRTVDNIVLTGSDALIPESVLIRVPVYEDLVSDTGMVFATQVETIFRVNAPEQKLQLLPLADQLLAAVRLADAWVLEQLKPLEELGENVRVFCGSV